ncbi:MAG: ribosomal protein S18-alanine N-acetyltransferase [Desulfurococcaceae archaeon TW002]
MVTIHIRKAKPEDLPTVININLISLKEHYPEDFWRHHLEMWGEAFLVADVDSRVVGYIMCRVERGLGHINKSLLKKLGHIISIAVHPDYRRIGIGYSLMVEALRKLKEFYKVSEVYLEVRVSNEPAIKLYEKLGFKKVQRIRFYYLDGEDAWLMAKEV